MLRIVLIVDDNSINRMVLRNTIQQDYEVLEAQSGEDALSVLRQNHNPVSAVLLDIMMPGMDGYEVLRRMRSDGDLAEIPVIMVTGSSDEASRVKAISLGANDFIQKPFSPEIILHCLKNNITLHETVRTVKTLQRDCLTGLYSREAFFGIVQEMVSSHNAGYYVMAYFDVDRFKVINDQYGTEKGDEVLCYIADTFKIGFNAKGGIVCRVSADVFVALYPSGLVLTEELKDMCARAGLAPGILSPIVFRIGRYIIDDLSLSPSAMCDRAMLAAESVKGRYDERIATYDEVLRLRLLDEQNIVNEMQSAVVSRQFEVWYQPQYNHSTGALVGAEALVRWRHPEKGLIPPGVFIPIFERNGFISTLDQFVWEEVCRLLRKWMDEGRNPLPVSVNISRYDILNTDLTNIIVGLVEKHRIPVDMLHLEITESVFAQSPKQIVGVVEQLIRHGFIVEIDDFGSGYSSLNTLKDVPVQIIKLDMRFLENSRDSRRGGSIIEAVVRMAKWLGMSIIAEGVETLEQADYLKSIGCSYQQGYLFARPMTDREYEKRCAGVGKEEKLLTMETVVHFNNESFWDCASMDTLIFNSYVGAACILEYHDGGIELLRANDKFAALLGDGTMSIEDVLALNWMACLTGESRELVRGNLRRSSINGDEFTNEFTFVGIQGGAEKTYLRLTMRVIATTDDRALVYCTGENITAQRRAEQDLLDNLPGGAGIYEYRDNTLAIVYLNKSFWRLIGQDIPAAGEMLGESPIHPDDMPVIAHELADAAANRHDLNCDIRLSYKKTEYRKVHLVGRIVPQEDGVRIYVIFTPIEAGGVSVATVRDNAVIRKRWEQLLESRDPDTYMLFRSNVSQNTVFDSVTGSLLPIVYPDALKTFDEQVAYYTSRLVHPDDRAWYAARLRSEVLCAKFYDGMRSDVFQYRELTPADDRWLKCTMELLTYPDSTDVEAYLFYEDINEAKQAELRLIAQAETEPLTGLYNRKAFVEKFVAATKHYKAERSALFIIDLDGFKAVNDNFGHVVGDETLIELAQKLRKVFSPNDIICRLGGDEFLVGITGITQKSIIADRAALVCAMLHKSFSIDVQLSTSIGISVFPDDGKDFDTLYRKADAALYHVKGSGKDGYAIYTEDMKGETISPEMAIVSDISAGNGSGSAPKPRMLIVDDNELNREVLSGIFEDEFIIDTAAEGTAALTRMRRYGSGISVVLLDLMMPGMSGYDVLDQMRKSSAMQLIPVIVVSGVNDREASLEAIRHGAADFVTKPVDPEVLKVRVASALSRMENERLRAQNRYLALQNEEAKRLAEAKRHTAELTIALHAAERADIAKTQFLSAMSHEIRTPLNAVIGYNTLARNEMTGAHTDVERRHAEMKVMDSLIKSEVASRHLLSIINDVLDMSAIESGKMKVEHAPFDFRGLITALTVMFFSQARSKGVRFEVLFDKPVDEWFIGDQLRINQVLTNLLSNAVKFTPEGGAVTLSIAATAVDKDHMDFQFAVSDTGIGMTQEYLQHIWTPFEQAEASISRRFGGTGLGLSITKNLVELMGGSISVQSTSGVGSTFLVHMTLARANQPIAKAQHDFSNINALVVDDDAGTCDYIKLLFDRCGARCTTFTSGAQAVKDFAEAQKGNKPFNLCLVDWRMPGMDGFATVNAIRKISARELPIIVVTAYDFSEVSERAGKLAINKFVSKPLFQSSLFDLLANISDQPQQTLKEQKQKSDFHGARVLLVEDNNMNMEVAKRILISANLAVDGAWNGQEAIDIFTASKPGAYKAILMDVHMPVVDGYQATRMIRASSHSDARTIPIIAMTADVFAGDIAQARDAGMNDHISKPVDVETLYQKLAQYINGGENARLINGEK